MVKTFVEIGAAGFDTCLPLAKSGWKGISIEPVPYLFERTKKQYQGLDVDVRNFAVSDSNGTVEMAVARDDGDWLTGCSHVISSNHIGYKLSDDPDRRYDFEEKITVPCVTLSYVMSFVNHVDFLKIDAEGHELNILMGYSFILKPRFIKIEHKHVDDTLLCSKLKENGYLVWTEKDDIYGLI